MKKILFLTSIIVLCNTSIFASLKGYPSIEYLLLKSDLIVCCTHELKKDNHAFTVKKVLLGDDSKKNTEIKVVSDFNKYDNCNDNEIILFLYKNKENPDQYIIVEESLYMKPIVVKKDVKMILLDKDFNRNDDIESLEKFISNFIEIKEKFLKENNSEKIEKTVKYFPLVLEYEIKGIKSKNENSSSFSFVLPGSEYQLIVPKILLNK